MSRKHAYLIEAHKDDYTFRSLLRMLDYEFNDIFIHMDKKNVSFSLEEVSGLVEKSRIYFTERTSVVWGGYSQINAELLLLKKATETDCYAYYHLLSGEDLPIKKQSYIHDFFAKHSGTEFVRFEKEIFECSNRVRYYYWLQEKTGRKSNFWSKAIKCIQIVLRVNRNRKVIFQKGANWFSITDNLARYVVAKEPWIKRVFHDTVCCDEVFLQTLIINSEYKNNLTKDVFDDSNEMFMRLIDWQRGKPYIFKLCDLNEIKESPMLFARKFSSEVDVDIIDSVVKLYAE
ncbi:MAG: glycosyl transferase [Ruminococcaceae bacterium]|nr:glycosyl transferase [Oscillospiraceae bacterium]